MIDDLTYDTKIEVFHTATNAKLGVLRCAKNTDVGKRANPTHLARFT